MLARRPFIFKTSGFQLLKGSNFFIIHIPALFYEYLIPNPDSLKFSFLLGTCSGAPIVSKRTYVATPRLQKKVLKKGSIILVHAHILPPLYPGKEKESIFK